MPVFPPHLTEFAQAHELRASPFTFPATEVREEITGTAVVGSPEGLEALSEQVPEGVYTFLSEVLPYSREAVLYFPDYHLTGEQETQ